jgi:hypothetical protein
MSGKVCKQAFSTKYQRLIQLRRTSGGIRAMIGLRSFFIKRLSLIVKNG